MLQTADDGEGDEANERERHVDVEDPLGHAKHDVGGRVEEDHAEGEQHEGSAEAKQGRAQGHGAMLLFAGATRSR